MMHDFAITERHVVFLDLPVVYDLTHVGKRPFPARVEARSTGPASASCHGTRARHHDGSRSSPATCSTPSTRYDEGDTVVLDVVRHAQMFTDDLYGIGRRNRNARPVDHRPAGRSESASSGSTTERRSSHAWTSAPWAAVTGTRTRRRRGSATSSSRSARLLQHDLTVGHDHRREARTRTAGRRRRLRPGRARRPPKTRDGCSPSSTTRIEDRSDLVILDATDFGGEPVATVALPAARPLRLPRHLGTGSPVSARCRRATSVRLRPDHHRHTTGPVQDQNSCNSRNPPARAQGVEREDRMTEATTTTGRGRGRARLVAAMLALVVLLAACDWTQFGYDASHTNYNPGETAIGVGNVGTLTTEWTATTGDYVVSSPAVANGVVYVGSLDGKLYAFDVPGTTNCSGAPRPAPRCGPRPPAARCLVAGGRQRGRLRRLASTASSTRSTRPGRPNCSAPQDLRPAVDRATALGAVYSSPAVANGVVYVGSNDGKLYAFDAAGVNQLLRGPPRPARPLWTAATGAGPRRRWRTGSSTSAPAPARQAVAFDAARDHELLRHPQDLHAAVDRGHRRRALRGPRRRWPTGSSTSAPTTDAKLYAFDAAGTTNCSGTPKTCTPLWTATTGGAVSSPAVANGVVYVGSERRQAVRVRRGGDHELLGHAPRPAPRCGPRPPRGSPLSSPAVANGVVYVGSGSDWRASCMRSTRPGPRTARGPPRPAPRCGPADHRRHSCCPRRRWPTGSSTSAPSTASCMRSAFRVDTALRCLRVLQHRLHGSGRKVGRLAVDTQLLDHHAALVRTTRRL